MTSPFTGFLPANTYTYILNTKGGLTASLQNIQDGAGNTSPLQLSKTQVNVTNFNYNGNAISFAGAVTFSGAFAFTGTLTASTSVTFPTSGTLIGSGDTGTVTNAMIAANAITYAKLQSETASTLLGNPTGAGAIPSEITLGTGLSFSGSTLTSTVTSKVAQVVNVETGAVATGSTTMSLNDTIPQNTAGDQYMSLAITPTNSNSHLKIDVVFNFSIGSSAIEGIVALFQDSTANALAAFVTEPTTSSAMSHVTFTHYMTAGTTSSTTFKVRAGGHSASTMTFNGQSGSRLFGGVMASSITITEVLP